MKKKNVVRMISFLNKKRTLLTLKVLCLFNLFKHKWFSNIFIIICFVSWRNRCNDYIRKINIYDIILGRLSGVSKDEPHTIHIFYEFFSLTREPFELISSDLNENLPGGSSLANVFFIFVQNFFPFKL